MRGRRGFRLVFSMIGTIGVAWGTLGAAPPKWTFGPPAQDAAPPDAGPFVVTSTLPDPPPLRERDQYVVDLRWVRGDVYLVSMTKTTSAEPQTTPRVMGRFALELYEGKTLVERVRFDFPLLAAPDLEGVKLSQKLSTRIGVTFPATPRGTHFELWDRATDTRWKVPWPTAEIPIADAGATATVDASDAAARAK